VLPGPEEASTLIRYISNVYLIILIILASPLQQTNTFRLLKKDIGLSVLEESIVPVPVPSPTPGPGGVPTPHILHSGTKKICDFSSRTPAPTI
jgi:hypothetical protein